MNASFSVWIRLLVIAVMAFAFTYALPNVLPASVRAALPSFMPKDAMPLGLDLQGGAHLVLEVDVADVLKQAYDNMTDSVRAIAREKQVGYTNLRASEKGVELVLRDANQLHILVDALARDGVVAHAGADGEVLLVYSETALADMQKRAITQTLNVLRSRVDEFGVAEPVVQQQGDKRVIVELPGVKDVARAKAAIGRTAQLTFHLVDETVDPNAPVLPFDDMRLQETEADAAGNVLASRPLVMKKRPALTGEMLTNAAAGFDQYGAAAVDIAFDARGTRLFAQISAQNVGKRFAIVLDGKVYSAPVFREAIMGGRAQISGRFSTEEAQDLAAILNAGALPAKVAVVEERTIGPSLGTDSVHAGVLALTVGLLSVLVFMVIFYGLFGLFADVALVLNLVILVAVMSAVGFTLSLPGLAGMVLTLGMAVDANVLIYERMREEADNGKKPFAAMMGGFQGAFSTILDGHVTTLVAAVILFAMGTGPVKGFAVALTIGLLASLFTSVTLTRWICTSYVVRMRPGKLPI